MNVKLVSMMIQRICEIKKWAKRSKVLNVKLILSAAVLMSAQGLQAKVTCKSIEEDDGRGAPTLFVNGKRGAYSYNSFDGIRQVINLKCAEILSKPGNRILCVRIFKHPDGFTTDHYTVADVSDFTTLQKTSFVENSMMRSKNGEREDYATFDHYTVTCSTN